MKRHFVSALRVMAALGLTAVCGWSVAAPPAMALDLPKLDGTAFVRLDDYAGRPVLLNFWGSECPPCIAELPTLFAQAQRHPGLQFLGIAVDQRAAAARLLGGMRPTYPQLLAVAGLEVLMRRFGNPAGTLPYTAMLDARHRVCMRHLGAVDAAWLAAAARACAAPALAAELGAAPRRGEASAPGGVGGDEVGDRGGVGQVQSRDPRHGQRSVAGDGGDAGPVRP
jgi:thiol-disulfide isomerase/thioredoxin